MKLTTEEIKKVVDRLELIIRDKKRHRVERDSAEGLLKDILKTLKKGYHFTRLVTQYERARKFIAETETIKPKP